MTAVLWIPGPLPGMNDLIAAAKGAGGTGRAYSRLKRQWTEAVWALAKARRVPFFGRAHLVFEWREKNCRRDPDNIAAAKKLVLDGLVQAGVLTGDGWSYVSGWTDRFRVVPAGMRAGVMVTLKHMEGDDG